MQVNREYGRPNGTGVKYAPSYIEEDTGTIFSPSEADYNKRGYWKMARNQPETREGYTAYVERYAVVDGKTAAVWAYRKDEVQVSDYDAAMEEHITNTRVARGYTTREPSAYAQSTDKRYAQDAKDWAKFVDAVMHYGLKVMNDYEVTGEVPSMAEFKAGLPTIEWTAGE